MNLNGVFAASTPCGCSGRFSDRMQKVRALAGGGLVLLAMSVPVACGNDAPQEAENMVAAERAALSSVPGEVPPRASSGHGMDPAPRNPFHSSLVPPGSSPISPPSYFDMTGAPISPFATTSQDGAARPQPGTGSGVPGAQACTFMGKPFKMTNGGTSSISHPRVSLVYWGSWASHPYDAYWQKLAATPAFYNRLQEYGVSTGSWNARYDYASGATGSLTEETIIAGIKSAIGTFAATRSDIFVVALPTGTSSLGDTQYGYGGHHASYKLANGTVIPWAVIEPQTTAAAFQWKSSHEVVEAITDPNATGSCPLNKCSLSAGTGWTPEVGDNCNGGLAKIAGLTSQQVWSNGSCRCVREEDLNNVDSNANGRFAPTVFRSTNNGWYSLGFPILWTFGVTGQGQPFAGDFDGDGRAEFAFWTPAATGTVSVLNILTGIYTNQLIGTSGDHPVPGDYDGDGKTDVAVWTPSTGNWTVIFSSTGVTHVTQWGASGDQPIPADYDNDGKTDFAVMRPSTHQYFVLPASGSGGWFLNWTNGPGDIAVPGDFNGDGLADLAYVHLATYTWFVAYTGTSTAYRQQWGQTGDYLVGRDVDGDFITDLSVWRPSDGNWYTIKSSDWSTTTTQWGASTDVSIGNSIF